MKSFSLVIITLNEESNIKRCIEAVSTANEVIVVDSGSTDRTVELAKSCGAKVLHQDWLGYGKQKQFAMDQAKNDWVLLLDADEFINKEVLTSIEQAMSQSYYHAFRLIRHEVFMGRELTRGRGINNPIRFHRKSSGKINSKEIHEEYETDKPVGTLSGFAIHHSAMGALDRLEKILRDAKLEKLHHKRSVGSFEIFFGPVRYFLSYLFKKQAFRDGLPGIILLVLYTFQMFVQNVAFYEKENNL